ncbi:MAG TPA: LysE family transporter [Pseudomonadales bacterium]|nr:LysE family transporter [Pseudomonadales bacterium]
MAELPPILLAMLTGLIAGMLLSMPIGPVNLTIINEGARKGFLFAALIGLGAASMEVIYCAIAFTGFSSLFGSRIVKASMEVFSFAFFLFLGIRFLTMKTIKAQTTIGLAAEKLGARLDEKFHPHSAFMIGFVRVFGNFGVLLFWIGLAAYFMSHPAFFTNQEFVADSLAAKAACILGVWLGANLVFCALSFGVSRGKGQFNESTLLRMQFISGICLLAIGIFDGIHIAWQLAKHKI